MSRTRSEESSSRSVPWRTILTGSFAAALVVQGFFSFAVHPEPYPTIRMPAFGAAAAEVGTIPVSFVSAEASFEDGSRSEIDPSELMTEFRFSMARPSYDFMFSPDRSGEISDEVVGWLRHRVEAVSGGVRAVQIRMCWRTVDVSVRDASLLNHGECEWTVVEL